ncbi:hypothetical protein D3C85_629140 [compost metagenome]
MAVEYVVLPLSSDSDYEYQVSLEGNAYTFRIYYNNRCVQWFFDLTRDNGTAVVLGEALVALYPIMADYAIPELNGFLFLEPIGESLEKYRTDPFNLYKWFKLYYIFDSVEA